MEVGLGHRWVKMTYCEISDPDLLDLGHFIVIPGLIEVARSHCSHFLLSFRIQKKTFY